MKEKINDLKLGLAYSKTLTIKKKIKRKIEKEKSDENEN